MKNFTRIFFVITILLSLIACGNDSAKLQLQHGKEISMQDLKGKWVFVNYWASWCKPCYKEIPEINAFYKAYKNKNVVVFGVSYDHPKDEQQLAKIIKQMKIEFPTIVKDPKIALQLGDIPGLPAMFVFGPDGKLKEKLLGAQTMAQLQHVLISQRKMRNHAVLSHNKKYA